MQRCLRGDFAMRVGVMIVLAVFALEQVYGCV